MQNLNALQEILAYNFNDLSLLKLSLTHRSYSRQNNERLEFIGDSVLDYVIASNLYSQYPHFAEGELSKAKAALVNQDILAEIAIKITLGQYILLGPGEEKSGGSKRPSILGDCLEAIIGAVSLDSSYIRAENVITNLYYE